MTFAAGDAMLAMWESKSALTLWRGDADNTPYATKDVKRAYPRKLCGSNNMTARKHPLDRYLSTFGEGTVTWNGVRPRRREPLASLGAATAVFDQGLEGTIA